MITLQILVAILLSEALLASPSGCRDTKRDTKNDLITLRQSAELWRARHDGACPTVDQLKADGELAPTARVIDRSGTPYRIVCVDDDVVAMSAGRAPEGP